VVVGDRTVGCLVDPLVPPVSLVIVGAGRGAEAFATIANSLGWRVTLVDHRPFVLQSLSLPEHVDRVVARAEDGVAHVTKDARTAVALLTHQFAVDAEWLARLLPLPIGYVGVLGSRQRAVQLMDSLRNEGLTITPRMQQILHAPIGLDLGGESPESIALAAIAEIEAILHGRPGGSLRERQSPIHTRTPTPHAAQ
jgi:xanthine/CO dehydrogenase XdhC/CoxF family maturation factor